MAATYTLDMSDADGNLLSETDSRLAGVNVSYQYTPEGQTSAETLTNAGSTALSSQGYTYDQSTGLRTNAARDCPVCSPDDKPDVVAPLLSANSGQFSTR